MIKDKKRKRSLGDKIDEGGNKVDGGRGHLPRSLLKEGRLNILSFVKIQYYRSEPPFPSSRRD